MRKETLVYVVQFRAVPTVRSFSSPSGAYINAYVKADTESVALELANHEITLAGWSALQTELVARIDESELDQNARFSEYYQQCLIDGVVLVVHTWEGEGEA